MTVDVHAAVEAFLDVRDLPYAIDKAHDADALEQLGAGDCLAKSALLGRRLAGLGMSVRFVRWLYLIPSVVPEVDQLPDRLDLHRAVEARWHGGWILVDPTHDVSFAAGGLTVAEWDGLTSSVGAYPHAGPVLVEGVDDRRISIAVEQVAAWVSERDPATMASWRRSYADWLQGVSAGSVSA
jgi:hypothetical protein